MFSNYQLTGTKNPCILFAIKQTVKINNQITAPELLVIDESGKNLGVISLDKALQFAKESGKDLIEISPFTKPPVAKIISYDKFRYQQEKKLKKQKLNQKETELKQIQISVRAAQNDLQVKANQAKKFMDKGHIVRIILVLKGREKGNRDFAKQKLNQFLGEFIKDYKLLIQPKFAGRGLMVQIQKN